MTKPPFAVFMAGFSSLGYEVTNIVFIDMMMPDRDGIEVLKVLAEYKVNAAIVLMSGADTSLSRAEDFAKQAGLRLIGVLHKPFRLSDVRSILAAD